MKLLLRICSICKNHLQLFCTFKQDCVENSLRLEARIMEAQDNTDIQEKCTTSDTFINKIHEVYIKEEAREDVLDESNTPTGTDYFVEENLYDREVGDERQVTLKEDSPPQTDSNLHEGSSLNMGDESYQNSDDRGDIDSVNNEIQTEENILITGSPSRKTYTCLICKKGFKDLSYLKTVHMKIHIGKKDFQCNECNKWFSQKSNLVTHMKQHTGLKQFQCEECKKRFVHKSNLAMHMKKHTGIKDFQCNICKKWFPRKANLATHMKTHTGVKEFQCNECKKWFTHKSHLDRHMKQHSGVRDFQCNECKKCFSQKSTLIRHMKHHTGVKDFQCNECKKMFSRKSNLAVHMKLHTGVKDLKCIVCNEMFSDKSNLNTHMKIHARIKSEGSGM